MRGSYSDSHLEIYKSIIEHNNDGIFVLAMDGTIMEVNQAAINLFGYSQDEFQGRSLLQIAFCMERGEEYFRKALQGIPSEFESDIAHRNGGILRLQIKLVPLYVHEEVVGVFCVTKDITVQRQLETSLRESEERYRRLVENSPEPIVVYKNEYIQYANSACIELLGESSLEGLVGKSIFNYFHPDSIHFIQKRIREVEHIGTKLEIVEEKLVRRDGAVIDVEVTGMTILHEGQLAFLMMYHDIRHRKRSEEALRQSEEKYRLIAENMHDLICLIDWDGRFIYASPSHATLLGFPAQDYEGNFATDWMHKADHRKVRNRLEDSVRTQNACMFEFRFRDVQDHWVWLEGKATPVFDGQGNFLHFLVVSRNIDERKAYEEKLAHLAFHDALTGLPNRRLFQERFNQAIQDAERYGRKMAVLYMDMDRFKAINDTLGHDIGDRLLKQYARRIRGCLRERDTLARQGGDEFTVLLPEIETERDALEVAHRILLTIQRPWKVAERVFQTTSSIGIAFYPTDGTTRHELLDRADTALYCAKESGKNSVRTYSGLDAGDSENTY